MVFGELKDVPAGLQHIFVLTKWADFALMYSFDYKMPGKRRNVHVPA
jgi:hypothetical protein